MLNAHRVFYEEKHGTIASDLHLDHLCRVRRCVNPGHMEPVTPRENVRRSAMTKLSVEVVREMRVRYRAGESQSALARKFGVSATTARLAIVGQSWADVE